jgi:putative hydroxymethylpyrimidine transport system substrate-binding protein
MRSLVSRHLAVLVLVAAVLAIAGCSEEPKGLEKVRLALDFQPNAVHAGIYTALRDGADGRHGVKLEVRVPSASTDSLKLLSAGRADMAVVDIHDLALARERGEDLVGVGALVQRPLAAVIARSGIRRPRDLEGRRVGVTGLPSDDAVLRAVVTSDGGNPSRVHRVTIGFSAVPSLVTGRVDAALAFWNAEGVTLRRRGVHTREFRVDRYGAPPYPELVLAVTRRTLDERRDVVRETLAALADGTEEALSHPPTAVGEIARVSGEDEPVVAAQLRALTPALRPPMRLDPAVLRKWARFDVRFGILDRPPDLRRAFALGLAPPAG